MKCYCVSCWREVEASEQREEIIYPHATGAYGAIIDLAPHKVRVYECPRCGYPTLPASEATKMI